jgi:ferredoxin
VTLARTARLDLSVDRIRCDGSGLCAEMLPELVALDDWGYPTVREGAVPTQLEDLARRVVETCPVLALTLRPREAIHADSRPVRSRGTQQRTFVRR